MTCGGRERSVEPDRDPEAFWDDVLSRDPGRIRAAFGRLSAGEEEAVLAHLRRMAAEAGWQDLQREGARVALRVVEQRRGP
jgi:hypothetical protein